MQTEKQERIVRCTICRTETAEGAIPVDATCCPKCGTVSLPQYTDLDVNVTINWHELRILCMWAKNYESQLHKKYPDMERVSVIDIFTNLLSKYRPNGAEPLSLFEEIQEAVDNNPVLTGASVVQGDEVTEITKEKKTIH